MKIKIILFVTAIFFNYKINAQQWQIVGDSAASSYAGNFPKIKVDKFGTPYIVYYSTCCNSVGGCVVRKFDGTKWINVGSNVADGIITGMSLAFDTAGAVYVAYQDAGYYPTVKKFDGTNWVLIGNAAFTPSCATYISLQISKDNTPYISFRDIKYSYSASVMKFDGTNWVYVGSPGFSPRTPHGGSSYNSLAIDKNGKLYVAFTDMSSNWRASVMTFNGTNWVFVGSPDISGGQSDHPSLVLDSQNRPVIAYTNGGAHVKMFDGSNWISVGNSFGSNVAYTDLAIDKHNNLYLAYTDNQKANVQKNFGSGWHLIGTPDFSPGLALYTTFAVDNLSNDGYVCFWDGRDKWQGIPWQSNHYSSAMVWKIANPVTTGSSQKIKEKIIFSAFPNPANNKLVVKYFGKSNSKCSIKLISISNQTVFSDEFSESYNAELDLTKYSKGIYFIEVNTPEGIESKTIILE